MKCIINVRIYDFETFYHNGYIKFDKTIIEVGSMENFTPKDELEIIDGHNKLLLPGFVNAHSHIYSTFARGFVQPFNPKNFKELLEQRWWSFDKKLGLDAIYHSAKVSGYEYLSHGITTLIDHHASGTIIGSLEQLDEALTEIGIRHDLCFETSDRFSVKDAITENVSFSKIANTKYLRSHFGLHASFTLSDETLLQVQKHQHHIPIHIHVAESNYDQENSISKHGLRVVERLDQFGLIKQDSLLAHCIHVDETELDIIKNRKAVIVLNPTSNMNNGVGLPDFVKMKKHHIPVVIGNDGINFDITKEYQSLFFGMHQLYKSPTTFSIDDLISVIRTTYEYVSRLFNVKLGKIKKGYQADFQLVDYIEPTPINQENIFGHLFFGLFGNWKPFAVFIDGENKIVKVHEQQIKEVAKVCANKLWAAIRNESEL
jgi:putative selenium metabolism protein SsnA